MRVLTATPHLAHILHLLSHNTRPNKVLRYFFFKHFLLQNQQKKNKTFFPIGFFVKKQNRKFQKMNKIEIQLNSAKKKVRCFGNYLNKK